MTSHLLIAPMSSPQAFHDFVDIHGVHLGIPGISEVGLRKRDALEALRLLRQTSVPVLGGDVYSHNGHTPSQRTRIGAVADDRAKVSAITRSVAWIKPKPTLIGTLRREPLYSCSSFTDRTSDDYPA